MVYNQPMSKASSSASVIKELGGALFSFATFSPREESYENLPLFVAILAIIVGKTVIGLFVVLAIAFVPMLF